MSIIHLPIYIHVSTLCFPCYYMVTTGSADWNPHPEYQILIIYSHLFKNTDPLLHSPTLNYYFAQLQCTSHIHALFLSPLKKKKKKNPKPPSILLPSLDPTLNTNISYQFLISTVSSSSSTLIGLCIYHSTKTAHHCHPTNLYLKTSLNVWYK